MAPLSVSQSRMLQKLFLYGSRQVNEKKFPPAIKSDRIAISGPVNRKAFDSKDMRMI
jgi:hypothetical protein